MCGICGFCGKKGITKEQLKIMNDSMLHRGPDDSGEAILSGMGGYVIGMAQRRLSILDLSETGHQPMTSNDGKVTVVYNGEIYNFQELKKKIPQYSFKSNCDTEVILAAYQKWGIDCVEHFNGMFAIALYDREKETFYLIRDRIGKKPLYYWLDKRDGVSIVFASELKAIMLYPMFPKKIRKEILVRYLVQGYINAPETIFQDVYKLEPGSVLDFHNGKVKQYKYWDIAKVYHCMQSEPINGYFQAKNELKELLKESVKKRVIADVPLGALLSGGYDSSLIVAIAQEIYGSTPLKTFSIGFHEEKYNEAMHAKKIAEYLGTKHTELYCQDSDIIAMIDSIPQYYDEPFADPSELPTMLVAKLAREKVTVALSGDGGDEFFCGYNIYESVRQAQLLNTLGSIANLVGRIGNIAEYYPNYVKLVSQNAVSKLKAQPIINAYIECIENMILTQENMFSARYDTESIYAVRDWQIRRMLLDMDTYLPGDILTKVDRASMKYSLECRCPILDKNVMEFSFRLSHKHKYRRGVKKRILKDIAYDYIPKTLLDRPKMGFGIPLVEWSRGFLKERLQSYSDISFLKRQDIFSPENTNQIVNSFLNGNKGVLKDGQYAVICWNYFVFQQWYEEYLGR